MDIVDIVYHKRLRKLMLGRKLDHPNPLVQSEAWGQTACWLGAKIDWILEADTIVEKVMRVDALREEIELQSKELCTGTPK